MKDSSWLKVYRKIIDWEWFSDSKTFHTFIYLLIRANIKQSRWNGHIIRRGQLVTSYQKIAAATGMSVSSAKRAIVNLVSTGEIIAEPTNRYNLITIVKYELYQAQFSDEEHTVEQANEQSTEHTDEPPTELSTEPSTEQRNKKDKKTEDKEKKKRPISKPTHDEKTSKTTSYIPRYFEIDLKIPRQYYGKFNTENEWWDYVAKHREEVEKAYEL